MFGCAAHKSYLPSIPKDVKLTGLDISVNSPWGGTTSIKAEAYEGTNYQQPPGPEKKEVEKTPLEKLVAATINKRIVEYYEKIKESLTDQEAAAIVAMLYQAKTLEELDALIGQANKITGVDL